MLNFIFMKKKLILVLGCAITLLTSFTPSNLSSVKVTHPSVVKKIACATWFYLDVSCGSLGNVMVEYMDITGVHSWAPYASCNTFTNLGSRAFVNGTYTVKLFLSANGGTLTGGGGTIYSPTAGVVASWSDADVDPSSLTVTLSVYFVGCGETYYINVNG